MNVYLVTCLDDDGEVLRNFTCDNMDTVSRMQDSGQLAHSNQIVVRSIPHYTLEDFPHAANAE